MRKQFLIAGILFSCFFSAKAQEFSKAKRDRLFNLAGENEKAFGSFSLYLDGREICGNAFGYSDLEKGIKTGRNTTYRIGKWKEVACYSALF